MKNHLIAWSFRLSTFIFITLLTACTASDSKTSTAPSTQPVAQPEINNTQATDMLPAEPVVPEFDYAPYARVVNDHQAALATVNPLATQAGVDAIRKGGNAIDAAVAMALTLGVVDSHNSGIGGGCFILARLTNGRVIAIDGREMAPGAADKDMYLVNGEFDKQLSKTGALAIGIPGSLAALEELQKTAGKLSLKDVILPAADLAERGFAIDGTMAKRLARTAKYIRQFPETAAIFLTDDGRPLSEGQVLQQKDLANSYRQIATMGSKWFYKGEFATLAERWMQENGGIIKRADFETYKTVLRHPVSTTYRGYTIYGFPPPSSGGVHIAQMLNMLEPYDLPSLSEVERRHLQIEVMRLAFADRAHWLGDADFVKVPKGLISKDYAHALTEKINMSKAGDVVSHGTPPAADSDHFNKHTTHIAAADASGNWVAITTTLNTSFGSKVIFPGTGILMNNQMDDFSAQEGKPNAFGLVGAHANSIEPRKRPLSSMSPTIISKEGKPVMTLGAAGGPTIINQVLQTLVNVVDLDMSLSDAVSHYRLHQQWRPPMTFIEEEVSPSVKTALEAKGHQFKNLGSFGGTQAILLKDNQFTVVTEPRVIKRNREMAETQP